MTNKERIVELSKHFNPIEVAEMCNVSAGYVYRVLREHHPKTLTTQNYLEAIQMGITNKEELAKLFKVSRRTILRFEQNNITKEAIGGALYIAGRDIDSVKQELSLTNQEAATLSQLPTLPNVVNELQKMLKALEPHKKKTTLNAELYQKALDALNALKC